MSASVVESNVVSINDHAQYQTPVTSDGEHVYPVNTPRTNGSKTHVAPYLERERSQRIYLAMYHSPNRVATSLVMVDPEYRWERSRGIEKLILLSDMDGSVRKSALVKINSNKPRDLHRELILQTKNLIARRFVKDFQAENVELNNGSADYVHVKTPLIINLEGHRIFVDFKVENPGRGRRPAQSDLFEPSNPNHSLVEVLIHDDKATTVDFTWNLGVGFPKGFPFKFQDYLSGHVLRAISNPLATCRLHYGHTALGKPKQSTPVKVNTRDKEDDDLAINQKDEPVDLTKLDLNNPDDLEFLRGLHGKLDQLFGSASEDSSDQDGKKAPRRLSREEFLAKKAQVKQELWESTDLFKKFHGTPLGEIAARTNRLHSYNEADKDVKDHNHDRGILANVEHWHTLAIRALHDLQYKNGEVIDIDEVLDFIEDGLAEVDPRAEEIKIGDNYQTRFLSVLAFYNANARELGLDVHYAPVSVQKMVKGRKVAKPGHHFTVAPSMGDDSVIVNLIAQGNYGTK